MKYQGRVSHWNEQKGFGFVEPDGSGARAFVHIKDFVNGSCRPEVGDLIVYQIKQQQDGRYRAVNICLAEDRTNKVRKQAGKPSSKLGAALTLTFCLVLALVTLQGQLAVQLAYGYVLMSLITFLAYAWDKSAAQSNRWRTKESTLHLLAILGGWPGAFYAQGTLRHKSVKAEFKRVYWATVLINIGMFSWLFGSDGQRFLARVLG